MSSILKWKRINKIDLSLSLPLKKKMCIKLDPEKKVVASWAAMGGAGGRETLLPNRHFSVSGYFV